MKEEVEFVDGIATIFIVKRRVSSFGLLYKLQGFDQSLDRIEWVLS